MSHSEFRSPGLAEEELLVQEFARHNVAPHQQALSICCGIRPTTPQGLERSIHV
jgi:hypothetical protein